MIQTYVRMVAGGRLESCRCALQVRSTRFCGLLAKGQCGPGTWLRLASPDAYLKRLCDCGVLEQIDRGLYRLVDAPVTELSSLAEVSKWVPRGSDA